MSKEEKLVAYVGPYSFPSGGAAARRIYGNCISLKEAGYKVVIASGQISANKADEYNGISVISLNERLYEDLPRALKHLMYLNAGKKTIEWLENLDVKPHAIILYSGYSPYLIRLIPWCKKNKVKLVFDVVEWYDAPSLLHCFFSPYYLNIELAMRWLNKKCGSLIVISEYLKDYYSENVERLVKIPPTVDCSAVNARVSCEECNIIRLVYAGNPGRKDSLSLIIQAVQAISNSGKKIELHIAGVADCDLGRYMKASASDKSQLYNAVFCHGVLCHEETLELVRSSHYSIVIRPLIRSVQAGFPTKFVESFAVGTPVIANITSDLELYLKNKVNGLVCVDSSLESIEKVLNECFSIANYSEMRVQARETAENYFDAKNYSDDFKKIIE
jgi:glycosyltransferase involved in cell wall biosynthesis